MPEIQKVIGLMSGTSLDGIDAALLETDGGNIARPGEALTLSYDDETREMLRTAMIEAQNVTAGGALPHAVHDAQQPLTYAHAVAVKSLLNQAGLKPADISLIGFHGQTVLHRPAQGFTLQLGDGALLARMTGIDVINDFRSADVAAGGQGAPLNDAKKVLATEATALAHGRNLADAAAETARATFEQGLSASGLPTVEIPKAEFPVGVLTLTVRAGLAASNSEARRHVEGGALKINDSAVSDVKAFVALSEAQDGVIKLSLGKKKHALVKPV